MNCTDPWGCRDPCDATCLQSPYGNPTPELVLDPITSEFALTLTEDDEAARCGHTGRPLTPPSEARTEGKARP